jgi:3-hydroxyacyl-CoA dehydrogenase
MITFEPRRAAVLGAGTMGAQIAAHLAHAGLEVLLFDLADGDNPHGRAQAAIERLHKLKPSPIFDPLAPLKLEARSLTDDLDELERVDWVIEAIIEDPTIKLDLWSRVSAVVGPDTVLSTNTSGIPIGTLATALSDDQKGRFMGTHFFNPPRYLPLLEFIAGADTAPDVAKAVETFCRISLGKGVVHAHDVPYFIGNRVGLYSILEVISWLDRGYTIEELDLLTGPLAGRSRSASFRTADVIGLDVVDAICRQLVANFQDDPRVDQLATPAVIHTLLDLGHLGSKSGAGFFKKEGKTIRSFHADAKTYQDASPIDLGDLTPITRLKAPQERVRALYADPGRAGAFFRESFLNLLTYAAARVGEVAERPVDIDLTMKWGFAWELGPFEAADAIGWDVLVRDATAFGHTLPSWAISSTERNAFTPMTVPVDEWMPPRSDSAVRFDGLVRCTEAGDGVLVAELRSKAGTLGKDVHEALRTVFDLVATDDGVRGLIIGQDSSFFSAGANLADFAESILKGELDALGEVIDGFHETLPRLRTLGKPVVVAAHSRALGGGCELVMAADRPVVAAESFLGLVELQVGLIPAGTGTTQLAIQAAKRAFGTHRGEQGTWVEEHQETHLNALKRLISPVITSTVSASAHHARSLGLLDAYIPVMRSERRFEVAREEVLRRAAVASPSQPFPSHIIAAGREGALVLESWVDDTFGASLAPYTRELVSRLIRVITGGDVSQGSEIALADFFALERETFIACGKDERTLARIEHLLKTGKPLVN